MTQKMMKAIRLTQKCEIEDLKPVSVEKPQVKKGYALVKVKAFGVNESEVTSRKGNLHLILVFLVFLGLKVLGKLQKFQKTVILKLDRKWLQ